MRDVRIDNYTLAQTIQEYAQSLPRPWSLAPGDVYAHGPNFLRNKMLNIVGHIRARPNSYGIDRLYKDGKLEEVKMLLGIGEVMSGRIKGMLDKLRSQHEIKV